MSDIPQFPEPNLHMPGHPGSSSILPPPPAPVPSAPVPPDLVPPVAPIIPPAPLAPPIPVSPPPPVVPTMASPIPVLPSTPPPPPALTTPPAVTPSAPPVPPIPEPPLPPILPAPASTPSLLSTPPPPPAPPTSSPPSASTPSGPDVHIQKSRHKKPIIWAIVGLVVAGLLGGGYFAYSKGYISIPFLNPKEDQLFNRLVDSLSEINNAQYTLQVGLESAPRSAGATSIFPNAGERKAQSRDAQRKSDLATIRTSLTLYFDEQHTYPDALETSLVPKYIGTLPTDPKDQTNYTYHACDSGTHFVLQTGLESSEFYYITEKQSGTTAASVPTCGGDVTNVSQSLLHWLVPTAHAQATTFSIESVGSGIGLSEPQNNYPLLNLLSIFGLGDLQSILDVFPSDINASAGITFYTETDKQLADADALLKINGSYRGDDLTAEFDLEGRKLGSTIYGTVRKFPGIPFLSQYVSPIKNKWVKIEPNDGNPLIKADTFKQTSLKSGVEKTKQSLKDALEGQIVTVGKQLGTENIAGVQSVHYHVELHPDKVKSVLEKIVADRKSKKQDVETLNTAIKQLEKPEAISSLQRFVDNSTVEVWVDKVKGYLRQIRWSIVLVPPDDSPKLKGKEFKLTLTLTLDKVNQPVRIDTPSGAINFDEAERLVTGMSVEEQKFNHQRGRVEAIRDALRQIHEGTDAYPSSIDQLDQDLKQALEKCKTKRDEAKNANTSSYVYCNDYLADQGPYSVTDVYTDKPYGYSVVGDDYNLTYEMKLDFEASTSEFSYSATYYKDSYIEGKNTATSKDESTEKQTPTELLDVNQDANTNPPTNSITFNNIPPTSNISIPTDHTADTDGDGLTDYLEVTVYRTDLNLKDSDSDTYDDKTEIDGRYNPLGTGKATDQQLLEWGVAPLIQTGAPTILEKTASSTGGVATFTFSTSDQADAIVNYGETTNYGVILSSATFSTDHSLTGAVTAGHTYHYVIRACRDSACYSSADATFVAN